ncbi:unnamed protein product [Caretta caretta]
MGRRVPSPLPSLNWGPAIPDNLKRSWDDSQDLQAGEDNDPGGKRTSTQETTSATRCSWEMLACYTEGFGSTSDRVLDKSKDNEMSQEKIYSSAFRGL